MLETVMNSKAIRTLYAIIFPSATILLLLGIASFNDRSDLFGSARADFFIRFLFVLWFCALYIRLSRFSSYRVFPNIKWTKSDVKGIEKVYYIGVGLFFGTSCGVITWWMMQWFFPNYSNFAYVTAIINGFLISLPMVSQYWILKL